jgi:hypothetical protein
MKKTFLTAHWKQLLFINYTVNPDILTPYLPKGTKVDCWNNQCFVSLVGFMFLDTRIKGIPIPFHTNFEEFNLRFYVTCNQDNTTKRGVVFIKEIVPRRMICAVAKLLYGEHYYYHPMQHQILQSEETIKVSYGFKHNKQWNQIAAVATTNTFLAPAGSEENFITEHYWGYTKVSADTTSEYQVVHPPWALHQVLSHQVNCDVSSLYGPAFTPFLQQPPSSVFLASGSPVSVLGRKQWQF